MQQTLYLNRVDVTSISLLIKNIISRLLHTVPNFDCAWGYPAFEASKIRAINLQIKGRGG